MDGTYHATMGDRGRLVVPIELRERAGLQEGTRVILFETDRGIVLVTREQLEAIVREDLRGLHLVDELLADRRREAAAEDED